MYKIIQKCDTSKNICIFNILSIIILGGNDMFDVFICHASEDKDVLVNSLATTLKDTYKLNVWYDEFSLKYGDSLIKSIERGLLDSKFGVVVFSKSFFNKVWTDHEIVSLQTKEMILNQNIIIPIWFNVTKEEVARYSLSLSDKYAIVVKNNNTIDSLATEIIKIVRPDIYDNISRMISVEKKIKESIVATIKTKDLINMNINAPIRHKKLSIPMKARLKLIHYAIKDVDSRSYDEYEEDFRKSTNLDREMLITELLVASYLDCIYKSCISYEIKSFIYIMAMNSGVEPYNNTFPISELEYNEHVNTIKNYLNEIDSHVIMEYKPELFKII